MTYKKRGWVAKLKPEVEKAKQNLVEYNLELELNSNDYCITSVRSLAGVAPQNRKIFVPRRH